MRDHFEAKLFTIETMVRQNEEEMRIQNGYIKDTIRKLIKTF